MVLKDGVSPQSLIAKVNRKPDVLVCSAGGVATTMLLRHFSNNGILTNDPMDLDALKHSTTPPELKTIKKAVYVFGNPQSAYQSLVRRNFLERQKKKTSGDWSSYRDPLGFEGHFESWMSHRSNYPILFVKYDDIWKNERNINKFLELDVNTELPKKVNRKSTKVDLPIIDGKPIYEDFSVKVENLPSIWIRKPDVFGIKLLVEKRKAAVVGLMRGHKLWEKYEKLLAKRNTLMHTNFNKVFNYPVIIFNEDTISKEHQEKMKSLTPNIQFVNIKKWWDKNEIGGGYKRMCLFNCSYLQRYLYKKGYDYYLRLDDDVFLQESFDTVDLFGWMKENDIDYVYSRRKIDSHKKTQKTLSDFCLDYFQKDVKPHYNYYNNLHASNTKFWNREDVIRFVDSCKAGIGENRWGDSSVQSAAIRGFGAKTSEVKVKYSHLSHGYTSFTRKGDQISRHEWNPEDL